MVKLSDFSFGPMVADNKKHWGDVFIFVGGRAQQRRSIFWMSGSHNIKRQEIENLPKDEPGLVIVGTGTSKKAHVSPETENWAREKKLELAVVPSYEAVIELTELAARGRRAADITRTTC